MKCVCAISGKSFEITDEDLKFYEKIGVPSPTLCPEERERRRLSWRGKNFFLRPCDKCQKNSFSWFSADTKGVLTYCDDCFQSDKFDATVYGREFDFDRPFFEQFAELQKQVPRHISNAILNENSEYIISAHKNKNCYMTDEMDGSWDCYFGYNVQYCKNIVAGLYIRDSEIGYDLVKAENCYAVFYSQNVFHCVESAFLQNCRSCKNCLFSANLRNKEYHVFNKPVSKDEYKKYWDFLFSGSMKNLEICQEKFASFIKDQSFPASILINTEDCTGNYITNSKNAKDCFGVDNCRDCRFCVDIHKAKDCYDVNIYEGELMYECVNTGPEGYNIIGSNLCWFASDVSYCMELHHGCKNCFGCAGLKKEEYCILNKKYSKKEYELLNTKIVQHMKKTGEYGEFFPTNMSPTPYNHTMAQQFYPLTKEEVLSRGWKWEDEKEVIGEVAETSIPENLKNLPEGFPSKVFSCIITKKKFRFTPQELDFYKKWGIPLPTLSPATRIESLWKKLGDRKLHDRTCSQCSISVQSVFSAEAPAVRGSEEPSGFRREKVLCEQCYLKIL
jgi:hypothetical protein